MKRGSLPLSPDPSRSKNEPQITSNDTKTSPSSSFSTVLNTHSVTHYVSLSEREKKKKENVFSDDDDSEIDRKHVDDVGESIETKNPFSPCERLF